MLWALSLTLVGEIVLNFIGSYGHIYVLGGKYGEHGVDDRILPVTIDGMLFALAIANVFAAKFNRRSRWLRFGLILGVGGTVAANAAYGASWGITGGLLSLWAPVALFVTTECGLFVFRLVADLLKEARGEAKAGTLTVTVPPEPFFPPPKAAPWETEALQAVPNSTANEREGKGSAPIPSGDRAAWERLNGIGLRNGRQ